MKIEFGARVTQEMVNYILSLSSEFKQALLESMIEEGTQRLLEQFEDNELDPDYIKACAQLEAALASMFEDPQGWMDMQSNPQVVELENLPYSPMYTGRN